VEEKPHTLANVLKLALSLTYYSVLVSNFAALLSGSERDGSYALHAPTEREIHHLSPFSPDVHHSA
jgi:hypothetical protein